MNRGHCRWAALRQSSDMAFRALSEARDEAEVRAVLQGLGGDMCLKVLLALMANGRDIASHAWSSRDRLAMSKMADRAGRLAKQAEQCLSEPALR